MNLETSRAIQVLWALCIVPLRYRLIQFWPAILWAESFPVSRAPLYIFIQVLHSIEDSDSIKIQWPEDAVGDVTREFFFMLSTTA